MSCEYSAGANEVQLNDPFSGEYSGGEQLYITFSQMENPISVREVGDFTVRTYTIKDG